MSPTRALLVACSSAVLACPLSAGVTTWYVDVAGTWPGTGTPANPYTSIQYAINNPATQSGDEILVAPGTYVENITFGNDLRIASVSGPLATVLRPASTSIAVVAMGGEVDPATLEGFTITGSNAPAAVLIEGSLLHRCIVRDNSGAGVFAQGVADVSSSTIVANGTGLRSAYFFFNCFDFVVTDSIVWGNGSDLDSPHGPFFGSILHCAGLANLTPHPCQSDNVLGDPGFRNLAGGDLHLHPSSPCIGAGQGGIDIGALPYDPAYAPGTSQACFGTIALCPCANGGSGSAGCDNAQGTGGVAIGIQDFAPDGAGGGTARITGQGFPPAGMPGVTLIRSRFSQPSPPAFGDGLLCIAPPVVRVRGGLAAGGVVELALTHGAGAGTFRYQLHYRNLPAGFCNPAAGFNLSDELSVAWP